MTTIITTKIDAPELAVIESQKAQQIRDTFEPMAVMLEGFDAEFLSVTTEAADGITGEVVQKAKRLRLDIAKVRIGTEKLRKTQKEEYLRAGKAIDGVSNILKWAVADKENELKKIENHFEEQQRERTEKLQNYRASQLSEYVDDATERNLAGMEDDVWDAYLDAKKRAHADRLAAEAKAKQDRIAKEKAEAEERERIRLENEQLKAEAEATERKHKKEQAAAKAREAKRLKAEESERKVREAEAAKEREAHEAELRLERESREKSEREERDKREKLEDELKAREEAERRAIEDEQEAERISHEVEEAAKQAELNKSDSDKVESLVDDLRVLQTKYEFKSAKNKAMYVRVAEQLDELINRECC